MSDIKINGQSHSKEEALKVIENAKKITSASIEITNEDKGPTIVTDNGIDLDKELFKGLLEQMRDLNAQSLNLSLEGVPDLLNKNLTITLANPGVEVFVKTLEPHESRLKKAFVRFLMKWC